MQMHNFFPPCPPGGNSGRGCFLLPQEESRFLQLLVQKRIRGGGLTALEPQWFSFRQTLPSWEGDRPAPLCWFLPCSFVSWLWLEFLTKSVLELAGTLATSDWFVHQRCVSWGEAEGGGREKLSSVYLSGAPACSPSPHQFACDDSKRLICAGLIEGTCLSAAPCSSWCSASTTASPSPTITILTRPSHEGFWGKSIL